MPYKNKEEQRKFQRVWAKKKSDKNLAAKIEERKKETTHINLKGDVIAWWELEESKFFKNAKDWDGCVKLVRQNLISRKTHRLVIASLAIKACLIERGGDRRSVSFINDINTPHTLKKFAKDTGMNYSTLWGWIQIKTIVIDRLPKDADYIDWSAARIAADYSRLHDKDAIEVYNLYKGQESNHRSAYYAIKYLRSVVTEIKRSGMRAATKKEMKEMKQYTKYISRFFKITKGKPHEVLDPRVNNHLDNIVLRANPTNEHGHRTVLTKSDITAAGDAVKAKSLPVRSPSV